MLVSAGTASSSLLRRVDVFESPALFVPQTDGYPQATDKCPRDVNLRPTGASQLSYPGLGPKAKPIGSVDAVVVDMGGEEWTKGLVDIKVTKCSSQQSLLASGLVQNWLYDAKMLLEQVTKTSHILYDWDFLAFAVYFQGKRVCHVLRVLREEFREWDLADPALPKMSWIRDAKTEIEIEDGESEMTRGQKLTALKASLIASAGFPGENWERDGVAMVPITKDTAGVILGRTNNALSVRALRKRLSQEQCPEHDGAPWSRCARVTLRKSCSAALSCIAALMQHVADCRVKVREHTSLVCCDKTTSASASHTPTPPSPY